MTGKTPTKYARGKKIHMKERKVLTAAGICIGILILTEEALSILFKNQEVLQKLGYLRWTPMEFTAYGKNSERGYGCSYREVPRNWMRCYQRKQ